MRWLIRTAQVDNAMPSDVLQALPGYDPDVQKSRADARQIMQKLGYGLDNRLKSSTKLPVRLRPTV